MLIKVQGNPGQAGFLFHRVATKQACMKSSHNSRPGKRCSGHKPSQHYISLVHTYTCLAHAIHIDPSNTLRPCSLSLCDTHPPNKYHNPSLHHRRTHSLLSMIISHQPSGTHVLSPSIHTSISISLGVSSIAHTPCHSISHPCSPIMISRGSLDHKHTLSPPQVCIFSIHLSRPLSLVCQTSLGHVLGVFLSRLQTTTHYLLTSLPLSKMHV